MNQEDFSTPVDIDIGSTGPNSTRNRNIALGIGGALLLIFLCCCCLLVVLVILDPFNLDLYSRLTGQYDAVASAMPADTNMYVGANLLNLRSDKASKIMAVFGDSIEGFDVDDTDELIRQMDETLDDEIGMTFTEDVMPWVGQFAGFGFPELSFNKYGEVDLFSMVFAVEARDTKKADEFLIRLQDRIAEESGYGINVETYNGVKIYEIDSDWEEERFAFARSNRVVLFSNSMDSLEDAIDAQGGESLYGSQNYKNMMASLPGERMLTFYISGDQIQDFVQEALVSELGSISGNFSTGYMVQDMALAFGIVDAGIQMDIAYAYDMDSLSEPRKAMLDTVGRKPRSADLFPEDTYFFSVGQRLDMSWQVYQETFSEMVGGEDFDEMMEMLASEIGINIDTDLMPYLDGEYAVGVMPSSTGMLAGQLELPLGFAVLAETSDSSALIETMDDFNGTLGMMGGRVTETEENGVTLCGLEDPFSGMEMLGYGLDKRYLILGSSSDLVADMFANTSSLSRSDRYRAVWKAFPGDSAPVFYLDLESALGQVRESMSGYAMDLEDFNREVAPVLDPITFIAAGSSPIRNGVGSSTLIIFIPTE